MGGETMNRERLPLSEILASTLNCARELAGYGFAEIDKAIAQALLVEVMQRVAIVDQTLVGQIPGHDAIAEIFEVVLDDVRQEAEKLLNARLH